MGRAIHVIVPRLATNQADTALGFCISVRRESPFKIVLSPETAVANFIDERFNKVPGSVVSKDC